MLEQVLQPFSLFLLAVIAVYTVLLIVLLRRLSPAEKIAKPVIIPSPISLEDEQNAQTIQRFKDKADEAMRLNQTFRKFVPKQFVDHFAKHGSSSLELGRADEDELAILFCDIRGFTGLSELMSPQELMNFLNSYFLRMNDPIHQNGGFIDKFIGDAIMALFDRPNGENRDKSQDAIRAALDLRYAINIYNQHRSNSKYPPINIGIGIHFGPVIIGTVGSDDRMDTTVIGDSVNIAYRLEALAPIYHTDIVVSAQALDVAEAEQHFKYRMLDWVRVKGRKSPIEIYEIIDHMPPNMQKLKLANADLIAKGINSRIKQQWPQALDYFQQALVINSKDSLAIHHIKQCQIMQQSKFPANWDGALVL
ncbi:adenylate/guanylate cyclase domain-containing protein [Paraglaciecola sp.]|uniref:adenylate/guanylate cyclase domain-containing protein n=1 Tax=Paraglaciecola sp. TaxID=1920173 RepID=UPI0030F40D46